MTEKAAPAPVSTALTLPDLSAAKPPEALEEKVLDLDAPAPDPSLKDPALELIELIPYNVFHLLHKANKVFPVLYIPFATFAYGPYKVQESLYHEPWPPLEEIENRIYALEEILKTAAPDDPSLVEKKIHLADLKSIKARRTLKKEDAQAAVSAYAAVYQKAPTDVYPYVALNLANSLLLMDDVVTALPLVKKVHKDFGTDRNLLKALHATFVELYFLSGRYEKAWDELEGYVKRKEVIDQNTDYRVRVGDILFFLGKYQEASDWYQSVLRAQEGNQFADNVSWLYLAESVYQLGNAEVALKIFTAMRPYFEDTVYADVIRYRLEPSLQTAEDILKRTRSPHVKKWLHVETLKWQFRHSPEILPGDSFNHALVDQDYPPALSHQILAMQAYAYAYEKKYYTALGIYQKLFMAVKNPFLQKLLDQITADLLMKRGFSNATEKQAHTFLKYLRRMGFSVRTNDPEKIYELLKHNLDLMGMKEVAAEMTLHIVEKSLHSAKDKSGLYLRLADAMYRGGSERAALRALALVDLKLLDYDGKDAFYRLNLESLEKDRRYHEALEVLDQWEKEGTSAKNFYWIALKKIGIYSAVGDEELAFKTVEAAVGAGQIDVLPEDYAEVVNPLLAERVILDNKFARHHEAVEAFFADQDRIFKTSRAHAAVMAALSSALAMNKQGDVDRLMAAAKGHFDAETYGWLERWTRGELWINQVSEYLEKR